MKLTKKDTVLYKELLKLQHEMIRNATNQDKKAFEETIDKIRTLVYKEV